MEFWRSEGKRSHGKNSENFRELHDDGDLNQLSVTVRETIDDNENRNGMESPLGCLFIKIVDPGC